MRRPVAKRLKARARAANSYAQVSSRPTEPDSLQKAWPLPFLLDELWLLPRRCIVSELVRRGFWPSPEEYEVQTNRWLSEGTALASRLLIPLLGADGYRLLVSERLFGTGNPQIGPRIPFILVFGHELCRCLSAIAQGNDPARTCAYEAAALFNFGISIFDRIADHLPEHRPALAEAFQPAKLVRRSGTSHAYDAVEVADDAPELRILRTIVDGFLSRVGELPHSGNKLAKLLSRAHSAEVLSTQPQHPSSQAELRAKSTLPFLIIAELAAMGTGVTGARYEMLVKIGKRLGFHFWLLDDMLDLVIDCRSGSGNCLLQDSCAARAADDRPPQSHALVSHVLASGQLPESARAIAENLQRLFALRSNAADVRLGLRELRRCVTHYTRDWFG